ncbi:DinB family protein [Deinococcus radiotolerans]|uniref:Damage-inducible protein DinB n=1 Tax=Deinococcus radiotolerans TaxID=1309407 RepID=A0ABQ2FLF1_9DEIO|nr:DinB family protein [Deinococcus radiotolerans]GGL02643.1 damage-inducible protein DinB [Deinococcus radiotolerans]
MKPETLYGHLSHARRDLLATLRATPDEVLRAPLLRGERFHSILDLLVHTAEVEDGWIHGDFQGLPMVQARFPDVQAGAAGPETTLSLAAIEAYWQAVEADTRAYLNALHGTDLHRTVTLDDWPEGHRQFTLDGLIWHVLLHEVRHTAQIAALLRTQGVRPPQLDLLFYLPVLETGRSAAAFVNPPPEDS